MKKVLVIWLAFCFCMIASQPLLYGQKTIFHVVTLPSVKGVKPNLERLVSGYWNLPAVTRELAEQVIRLKKPYAVSIFPNKRTLYTPQGQFSQLDIDILASIPAPVLRHPSSIWGSYAYLRAIVSLASKEESVHPLYAKEWKKIYSDDSYRGIHHIVNRSTLRTIYLEKQQKALLNKEPFVIKLNELQRNAPASLHPFHGDFRYTGFFHNSARQLDLYRKGGIRLIVLDYFRELMKLHKKYPKEAPFIPKAVIDNTLLEAKLWSEAYGLNWE